MPYSFYSISTSRARYFTAFFFLFACAFLSNNFKTLIHMCKLNAAPVPQPRGVLENEQGLDRAWEGEVT